MIVCFSFGKHVSHPLAVIMFGILVPGGGGGVGRESSGIGRHLIIVCCALA
jgi:hypothetical protein